MIELADDWRHGWPGPPPAVGFQERIGNGEPCAAQRTLLACMDLSPVEKRTRPGASYKCLIPHGIDDGGENRNVIVDQGQRDHPIIAPLDEGAGSIDRIDNPDAAGSKTLIVLGAFLGKPAIGGTRILKPLRQQRVYRIVGFRHLRAIGLPLLFDRSAPIAQSELSGLLSGMANKIEVLRVIILHTS